MDGSPSDRFYHTSWTQEKEGHPFFMLEAGVQNLGLSHASDDATRTRAQVASNPSNQMSAWGLAARCEKLAACTAALVELLSVGQAVEVAPEWEEWRATTAFEGVWLLAWVAKLHGDAVGDAVDVVYARDGTLEERCLRHRVRVPAAALVC